MSKIQITADEIKAIATLNISLSARYIGTLMLMLGTHKIAELMAASGLGRSTVYRAQKEFIEANEANCPASLPIPATENPASPANGIHSEKTVPRVPLTGQIEPVPSCAGANTESPTEILNSRISFSTPFDERVKFENGRLIVCDEVRNEWVERFGSEERFNLALVQAAAWIQPNNRRPIEAQMASQLARAAGEKLDRDQRYAAAAANRPLSKTHFTSRSEEKIAAAANFRAVLNKSMEGAA